MHVASSFLALILYIFKVIQILIGQVALTLGALSLACVSSWELHWFHGRPRSGQLFLDPLVKMSMELLALKLVNFINGCLTYWRTTCVPLPLKLMCYIVTVKAPTHCCYTHTQGYSRTHPLVFMGSVLTSYN